MPEPARVLIVGGGYVGLYAALRLRRRARRGELRLTLVEPQPYMTYQPFLPEAAAGAISPRHVVVPLRRVLPDVELITGEVDRVEPDKHRAWVRNPLAELGEPEEIELEYDCLVLAPGSVSRTLPIPGLAEHGIGFKTVEEAIGLRNHVIEQLDIASSTRDPEVREAALTFVFVGGGYAGVQALAELEDMARYAVRYYRTVEPDDLRWILVEAADRILPEVDAKLAGWTVSELRARPVDVRLGTRLVSAVDGLVELSDGDRMRTRTLVWTAGGRPNPLIDTTGLPLDARGRLRTTPELHVQGTPEVWTAGDCAAVPDLERPGETCGASAQHAVRQAATLADNLLASLRDQPVRPYRYRPIGAVASLGVHKGVAEIRGVRLRGRTAWTIHRLFHLARIPTANRKARVLAEWTLAALFKREIVSLGSIERPRSEFRRAAGGDLP